MTGSIAEPNLRSFISPKQPVVYNLRSKAINTEMRNGQTRSSTPMQISPSTPGNAQPRKTPLRTPTLLRGVSMENLDNNLMTTPTRSCLPKDTPPCRPSKRRFRNCVSMNSKARRSMGMILFPNKGEGADSPGTQLSKIMQNCTIKNKAPKLRRKTATPTPKRVVGNHTAANRLLHSVRSKITK